MEHLLLARIDDRLIHGQVMTAWMKVLPAKVILIVDDKVAKDEFMNSVLEMAAPSGVKVKIQTIEDAIKTLKEGLDLPTMMLCKTPHVYKALVDNGVPLTEINIGGMGMYPGRKTLYKNISATEEERQILKEFIAAGIDVKIQIIPAEKTFNVKDLL